jgi:hypothetical protein
MGDESVRTRVDHSLVVADPHFDREVRAEHGDRPLTEGDPGGNEQRADDEDRPAGEFDRGRFDLGRGLETAEQPGAEGEGDGDEAPPLGAGAALVVASPEADPQFPGRPDRDQAEEDDLGARVGVGQRLQVGSTPSVAW